jgi:transposase
MDAFAVSPFCPAAVELVLDHIAFDAPRLVITAHARHRVVACPLCDQPATRVHSRYRRTIADLPWQGFHVRPIVETRRFFFDTETCVNRHPKLALRESW